MEYYSAIKKDQCQSFVEKWTHLETIMLSDIKRNTNFNITWLLLCGNPNHK